MATETETPAAQVARGPAEGPARPATDACCGSPSSTASPCCGTATEARAAGGCCGPAARTEAVAAGAGCCG